MGTGQRDPRDELDVRDRLSIATDEKNQGVLVPSVGRTVQPCCERVGVGIVVAATSM